MPAIWVKPDGTVRVMHLSDNFVAANRQPNETIAEAVTRLVSIEQAKNPDLTDATVTLVTSRNMPAGRTQRYKWRLQADRVVVDTQVPDQPKSQRELAKDALDAAILDPSKLSEALLAIRDIL